MLAELGAGLEFYDGIPEIFTELKDVVANDEKNRKFGIHVEHYIISTGLTAMIRGSKIADTIYRKHEDEIRKSASVPPSHINEP
jgi:hypothetical protein